MKWTVSLALIRQYAAVVIVNLGVTTTGMSLAWPSPALVNLRNGTETPLVRPITAEEGSWIGSSGFLLAIPCNIFIGVFLDLIGRKNCFILVSLPKVVVSIMLVFAAEVWMIIFCRAVMIVCDSLTLIVTPVYASEIGSKKHRSALGTFLQIFCTLGTVITLSVGPFLSYNEFNIVLASAIFLSSLPSLGLPDSPFYLFSKGQTKEALEILKQIRTNEEVAKEELEEYKESINKAKEKIDKLALMKNKIFLKAMFLGILLCGGSQLVGFKAILVYLETILESTKTDVKPEIASLIIGFIQLFASSCTTLISSIMGRRPIFLFSLSGIFLGMLGLGFFFKISEPEDYEVTGFMNYLPIISLILVKFSYCIGIGSLLWFVTAELFEGPARAVGMSVSIATSSVVIFLTTKYLELMTTIISPAGTYWFFSAMCVLVGTLIALYLPETKGKTFSEIQMALGGCPSELPENSVKETTRM